MTEPIKVQSNAFSLPENSTLRSIQKSSEKQKPEALRKVCQDFESIFISQMMQQMRQTVPKDGLFSGGQAEEIYTSMMDSEMAKTISQERGMGLADVLYRQLSALKTKDGSQKV
jgi:peptidoglycan hydrolase FlgJ